MESGTAPKRRILLIGLDGADWRLLRPWIEDGYLPTLQSLVEQGSHGKLRSTIRPESSLAWSSFATGVNPGKHGVFAFLHHLSNSYQFRLANGENIRARRFWEWLGDDGYRVALVNVPFTYPPRPVNGVLVSGMLAPGPESTFTYPEELKEKLLQHFKPFLFDAGEGAMEKERLLERAQAYTNQQVELALMLQKEEPWDLFAVVFTGPDRLQHFFWADHDAGHPLHLTSDGQQFKNVLLDHYRALDVALAELTQKRSEDTLLIVMSDHGFSGCARRFQVNRWLLSQGLLAVRQGGRARAALRNAARTIRRLSLLRRLKRAILPDSWGAENLGAALFARSLDWQRTSAYYSPDGGIRLNIRGREPQGMVAPGQAYDQLRQQLRDKLQRLTDPETGHKPIAAVFFREELYEGPYVEQAPDIIVEPHREKADAAHNYILDGSLSSKDEGYFASSLPYTANHAPEGILIVNGMGIKADHETMGATLADLAPTIMAAIGARVPDNLDGVLLEDLFEPWSMPQTKFRAGDGGFDQPAGSGAFDVEEEGRIAERLKNLGYLD